ncbi:MAG TPA: hypothetical protein PKU91_08295, partial [Phycisphaerales bacterium]|nr:hypothetical protein [Phycisphaerales bacterium]
GCLLAPIAVRRSLGPMANPALLAGMAMAGIVLGAVYAMISHATRMIPDEVVTQNVDDFLWKSGEWWRVLLLAPTSLVMALPASFALLFPWGPDAIAERHREAARDHPLAFPAARTITIAVLLSLGMLTIAGVSNPRYTMPTQVLIAPVAGYLGLGLSGFFIRKRPAIARAMLLGHPAVSAAVLSVAALVTVGMWERWRTRVEGRGAGELIASVVPPGSLLVADHLVEARPDVLWYAQQRGHNLRAVWRGLNTSPRHSVDLDAYYILRDDTMTREVDRFMHLNPGEVFVERGAGSVYQFSFRVLTAAGERGRSEPEPPLATDTR